MTETVDRADVTESVHGNGDLKRSVCDFYGISELLRDSVTELMMSRGRQERHEQLSIFGSAQKALNTCQIDIQADK
jgi:hypothetical protein